MTELLSVTGFLLALAAVFIGGEALRRVNPRVTLTDMSAKDSVDVLQKRIDTLENALAEMKSHEQLSGHRLNTELSDAERFAPSHHVLKRHYLA